MINNVINSIPPVTRIQILLSIGVFALVSSEFLHRFDLSFSFTKIFREGQIWRLVTSLLCIKPPFIFFIFQLYIFSYVSGKIETNSFKRGSLDYLYFICVLCAVMYLLGTLLSISYLYSIYKYVLYYYFGRFNTDVILINFLPIRAPYFLWFICMIQWIYGAPELNSFLLSILVGHTLYFLINVYPQMRFTANKKPLETPQFFIRVFAPLFRNELVE